VVAGVLTEQIATVNVRGWEWLDRVSIGWRTAVAVAALCAVVFSPGLNPAFIYFQF